MSQPAESKHPKQKQPNTDSKMKTQTGAIEQLNVKTTNAHPHRLWVSILVAAFVVLFCEVGLFNLGYWRTFHNPAAVVGKPVIGEGLEARGNSDYTVTNPEKATITVPVSSPDGQPVRVRSVRVIATPTDRPMVEGQENLYSPAELLFNIIDADSGETASHSTKGNTGSTSNSSKTEKVDATEDQEHWGSSTHSDGAWGDINNTLNYTTNPASQYIIIGKAGGYSTSTKVRVKYTAEKGAAVLFDRLEVNPTIPFNINPWRVLLEVAIAFFFILFRPSSRLYALRVNLASNRQRLATAAYIIAWSALIVTIAILTSPKNTLWFDQAGGNWNDFDQYQRLADALLHGHTWLDLPVDPVLGQLQNPYDFGARQAYATDGTMHDFYWDHAYFNGRYYCYFGVVPAVLLFAPYQLVTGQWLSSGVAIAVFSALAVAFGTLLVQRVARDYFPQASLGIVWLVVIAFNIGTNLFIYSYNSMFYGIPMACAIALVLMGLWFWQISKRSDGTVNPWLVAAGSICMALNLGTRPQFIAAWVIAFPLFWQQIRYRRTLFSRRGMAATLAAFIPFVVLVPPILGYNYVRFHSWFNFGQNYNLTGYDMTARTSSKYTMIPALFNQLFQPIATSANFPFVQRVETTLAGPNEPSYGGYFAIYPIALFALLFFLVRRQLQSHKVWGLACCSMGMAFVAVLVDTYKSGTSMRYYGDFAYLVMLTMLLVVLAYDTSARYSAARTGGIPSPGVSSSDSKGATTVHRSLGFRTLQTVLVTLVFLTFVITLLGMFTPTRLSEWYSLFSGMWTTVRSWFLGMLTS